MQTDPGTGYSYLATGRVTDCGGWIGSVEALPTEHGALHILCLYDTSSPVCGRIARRHDEDVATTERPGMQPLGHAGTSKIKGC